jgi:23S rRNA (uracil1939-C5)-methyltransferase
VRRERLFRKNQVLTLDIQDVAFGGKGIARQETDRGPFVIFVQNSLPGQRVNARVVKCKSKYAECKLEDVLERSPSEQSIPYQEIPGAPYAHLPIADQHALKEQTALELYRKIGNVVHLDSVYQGLVGSPENWHYRNKMEYSFSAIVHNPATGEKEDRFGLGFKRRGTWWAVEDLNRDSGLFDADVENALPQLRAWFESTGLPAWHPPRREGFFRFLVVRKSIASQRLLINLVTTSDDIADFDRNAFITQLKALLGDRIQGVLHTINDDKGERVEARAGASTCIYGDPFVTETLHGLDFDVEMASFFQTNPASAERLYEMTVDEATADWTDGAPSDGYVMDLFCGTGTIGQLLARASYRKVIGVDIVEQAIVDARRSAQKNGIRNIEFHAADVGKFLLEYPEYAGKIDTIVLDPPRAGISPKTLRKVIRLRAKRMVYVSCNPATQARDIATLAKAGYALTKLTLVDQFPHTSHVEAVGVFEKTADL